VKVSSSLVTRSSPPCSSMFLSCTNIVLI
jgi:hypothetical protein